MLTGIYSQKHIVIDIGNYYFTSELQAPSSCLPAFILTSTHSLVTCYLKYTKVLTFLFYAVRRLSAQEALKHPWYTFSKKKTTLFSDYVS
jgi:hypothetical protein